MEFPSLPTKDNLFEKRRLDVVDAVLVLLRKPAIDLVREVRKKADVDPSYLESHREEILATVQDFLLKGGLYWDIKILERDSMTILEQAVARLRQIEK